VSTETFPGSPEPSEQDIKLQEKISKNLLWFGIFSIIMLFAGITSGYLVAKDSSYWVDFTLPTYFMWSCAAVITSSGLLYLATVLIKKNNRFAATTMVGISLILGMTFGLTQLNGFLEMSGQGKAIRANIVNLQGRYGEHFMLIKDGKEITFDGVDYFLQGEQLNDEQLVELKTFLKQFLNIKTEEARNIVDYGKYILEYKGQPITYLNDRLELEDLSLSPDQKTKLYHFSEAIISGRGDFYMIGEYGKDFTVKYKGEPLEYTNRKFYRNGQQISPLMSSDLSGAPNRTSQFVLAFVVVHGAHWLAGIIVLIVLLVNTLRNKYSSTNFTGLKVGSIYWHFLGILWLYLYAFLNFIH